MNWIDGIWLVQILGEDVRFWLTVLVASLLKWLFTDGTNQTRKQAIAGMIAGACAAYYGYEKVINTFSSLNPEDRDIVIIGLVLTGEHLVRGMLLYAPNFVKGLMGTKSKGEGE